MLSTLSEGWRPNAPPSSPSPRSTSWPPKVGGKGRPQPAFSAWALDGGRSVQPLVNRFTGGEDGA